MCKFKIFILLSVLAKNSCGRDKMMPAGMDLEDRTSCEEFGKFARFNPYSVLDGPWKIFYFWSTAPYNSANITFTVPTKANISAFKSIMSKYPKVPIDWSRVKVYMSAPTPALLVETGDRGQHLIYNIPIHIKHHKHIDEDLLKPMKAVFKQKGKYIGIMLCQNKQMFALARKKDMPRKKDVQEAASVLGFRGRGGKSYLYQGNEWMPVGDADEEVMYGKDLMYL